MKRTITEKFDEKGNLIERVTVEEDTPPPPQPYQPLNPWTPIGPVYGPGDWRWGDSAGGTWS